MSALPLLTHAGPGAIVAWRHDGPVTAARFLADARRLGAAFPPGSHVLNTCTDRYQFAVGLAAALVGDRTSLLPPTLTPEMLRQVRAFAPDVFCLVDQRHAMDLPQVAWADVMADPAPGGDAARVAHDVPKIDGDRTVAIVFTSGSTGTPVPHRKTWAGLCRSVRAEAATLGLLDGRSHSIVATVAGQHMYGFESSVLMALQAGAALTASHPFYPADICQALAGAPRPCVLVTTPIHLKALLASGIDIPAPDLVLCATAPLSPQLALAVEERLGVPLVEIYGSTETGQIASRRTTSGASWTLFPGVTLGSTPDGTWASGGHVQERVVLADQIEVLDAGHFLLHGRTADLVNIAGKRSSLGYLDHQLHAVPGVQDAAFFMPDETEPADGRVTRLMAFVVAPGLSPAALLAALRERVDPTFLPRPIVLLDRLPRNANGKLPREALQALAAGHRKDTPGAQ